MSLHYGVKCFKCEVPIIIHDIDEETDKTIVWDVMPLYELKCANCGHQQQYGSEDGFRFGVEDSTPNGRL